MLCLHGAGHIIQASVATAAALLAHLTDIAAAEAPEASIREIFQLGTDAVLLSEPAVKWQLLRNLVDTAPGMRSALSVQLHFAHRARETGCMRFCTVAV